ncbi:hypothetical protein ACHHYP_20550 [Achlya hypogyna]|uniref:Myb-like domain-containing protein n=1 Tax=Achlya hypogyna TaxID=1202772 RepID=A0A1V9YJ67_ACHHY|nr:hypothetical protein ACHHYP_20550 [Achlya hypogyna]
MDSETLVPFQVSKQALTRRKSAFRFRVVHDVELLQEVANIEPYDAPHGEAKARWSKVAENLCSIHGAGVLTSSGCRVRFNDLIDAFKSQQMESLRASGTDEEYETREQLLQDISDLRLGDK